jgi:hypothetical protein
MKAIVDVDFSWKSGGVIAGSWENVIASMKLSLSFKRNSLQSKSFQCSFKRDTLKLKHTLPLEFGTPAQ